MSILIPFIVILFHTPRVMCFLQKPSAKNHSEDYSCNNCSQISSKDIVWILDNGTSSFVAVYKGAVAVIHCNIPLKGEKVSWTYSKLSKNATFTPIAQANRLVMDDGDILSIYRVTDEEEGAYRCHGGNLTATFVLEVVDNDAYIEVKPLNSETQTTSPITIDQKLTIYLSWSKWSECSACGKLGRRRRYGMCYVKLDAKCFADKNNPHNFSSSTLKLFQAFPEGIPCQSRHLPDEICNILAACNKFNQIMIAPCKVKCKIEIFEHRIAGVLVESANNTAGVYSLHQRLPPQPPAPVRNIMFVGRGQRVLVICDGTTLRDIPITWRVGDKLVDPTILRESSGGRVHVNARDHVIINHVLYEDSNLYSCWEGGRLVGSTSLSVWTRGEMQWNPHTTLLVMFTIAAIFLLALLKYTGQVTDA